MGTSSWLATTLDQEMLETIHGIRIAPRRTVLSAMSLKSGQQVSDELGGRYLLHYILPSQVGRYTNSGRVGEVYVTPTPYSPEEATFFLSLPRVTQPRPYAILLDPLRIVNIYGPRWVALGPGIEYILQDGFTKAAIVAPPGADPPWEILVR